MIEGTMVRITPTPKEKISLDIGCDEFGDDIRSHWIFHHENQIGMIVDSIAINCDRDPQMYYLLMEAGDVICRYAHGVKLLD